MGGPAGWNRFGYVGGNPVNYIDPSGHFITPWDAVDVASFGLSLKDFINDPSFANGGWLALDTISLLPILPSIGSLRHVGKLGRAGDAAQAAGRAGDAMQAAGKADNFAPGCAFHSFTADTLIHTEDGLVTIAKIKLGQKVFAVDPETGESGFYEVVYITNHPVDELLYISIDGDIMQVTPNHPIYIEGRGWVNAEDVALGDRLRRKDGGWANALAIERVLLDEPMLVYNFTVAGMHTYFVLEVGVLVHNANCPNLLPGEGDVGNVLEIAFSKLYNKIKIPLMDYLVANYE